MIIVLVDLIPQLIITIFVRLQVQIANAMIIYNDS